LVAYPELTGIVPSTVAPAARKSVSPAQPEHSSLLQHTHQLLQYLRIEIRLAIESSARYTTSPATRNSLACVGLPRLYHLH
jgi:hypothetical protein